MNRNFLFTVLEVNYVVSYSNIIYMQKYITNEKHEIYSSLLNISSQRENWIECSYTGKRQATELKI